MEETYRGNKILIIGSDSSSREIVQTAKDMGIYTICVDGIPKSINTPAKNIADESWDIDYSKIQDLKKKVIEAGVTGVIAGYSEFRTIAAFRLAKELGLPTYAEEEVFEVIRDKQRFKEACRKYRVKIPEYVCFNHMPDGEQISKLPLPCIVKPVDQSGRKGISVCTTRNEIFPALNNAFDCSLRKKVVVERFLTGREFSARYFVNNGEPYLLSIKDRYLLEDKPGACLACFELYPSVSLSRYEKEADQGIRDMIRGIGISHGVLAVQGIYNEDGFFLFESNYRIGGGNDQKILQHESGFNYIEAMIQYALTGKSKIDFSRITPHFSHVCAQFRQYVKGGTIGKMEYPGLGEIDHLLEQIVYKVPGVKVEQNRTVAQNAISFFYIADNIEQIMQALDETQRRLKIEDTNGNSMLYKRISTDPQMYETERPRL